ncbi:MAG: ATP-binding cassette domain-containing protein [Bacteroidales bacterium]|nr:ATP-binding cassette domain-containing protein [Bacteroidales bacterium]
MTIFKAENIVKKYANHVALKNVSINVSEGSIFGLLGPNGAGKTSLIRIINQITAPDEGTLFFKGEPLKPSHVELIGYLPEERGLYKKMKVGEQALYLAQLKGLSRQDALKKLKYWFEKFELQGWWNKKVEELSKGMQQKIQFIVTVLHNPQLLIFDEPFSGFDPINVNILKEEILNLKAHGATIIFSTHNMASVEELCDNIALLNKSEKILDGNVNDIKKTYKTNKYELIYNGTLNIKEVLDSRFEVLNQISDAGDEKLTIKINNGSSPNELLSVLLSHVLIVSFKEVIPSMNDIFIANVTDKNEFLQNA